MKRESLFKRWIVFHERNLKIWAPFFITLSALAFLLSDFLYRYFSFGDFIFIFMIALMFFIGQYRIKPHQVTWIAIPILILLLNMILSMQHVDLVDTSVLVTQSIKAVFYLFVLVGLYNFIKRNKLERKFLSIHTHVAFVAVAIGLYITIALYSNERLPHEFLWTFTRSHPTSYQFQGNPAIIRTRSLFSEPAHFGYYLVTILSAHLFNKQDLERNWLSLSVLILGILLTLSYSMIAILLIMIFIFIVQQIVRGSAEWKKSYFLFIPLLAIVVVLFWEFIDEALIQRTLNILSGEDSSTVNRLFESWSYVDSSRLIIGNGIGHTPAITNNYAYILSDLGLIGLIPALIFTAWLFIKNYPMAIVFVFLNVSRGGYLSPAFWFVCLFVLVFSIDNSEKLVNSKSIRTII